MGPPPQHGQPHPPKYYREYDGKRKKHRNPKNQPQETQQGPTSKLKNPKHSGQGNPELDEGKPRHKSGPQEAAPNTPILYPKRRQSPKIIHCTRKNTQPKGTNSWEPQVEKSSTRRKIREPGPHINRARDPKVLEGLYTQDTDHR